MSDILRVQLSLRPAFSASGRSLSSEARSSTEVVAFCVGPLSGPLG